MLEDGKRGEMELQEGRLSERWQERGKMRCLHKRRH